MNEQTATAPKKGGMSDAKRAEIMAAIDYVAASGRIPTHDLVSKRLEEVTGSGTSYSYTGPLIKEWKAQRSAEREVPAEIEEIVLQGLKPLMARLYTATVTQAEREFAAEREELQAEASNARAAEREIEELKAKLEEQERRQQEAVAPYKDAIEQLKEANAALKARAEQAEKKVGEIGFRHDELLGQISKLKEEVLKARADERVASSMFIQTKEQLDKLNDRRLEEIADLRRMIEKEKAGKRQ